MRTWNYRGTQCGYKTHIMRYPDGDIVIFQASNGDTPNVIGAGNTVAIRFKEDELRKILKDKKRFPKQKSKRGKKHAR